MDRTLNITRTGFKELILSDKLWFSNSYIFATQSRRPGIFQTMNSDR